MLSPPPPEHKHVGYGGVFFHRTRFGLVLRGNPKEHHFFGFQGTSRSITCLVFSGHHKEHRNHFGGCRILRQSHIGSSKVWLAGELADLCGQDADSGRPPMRTWGGIERWLNAVDPTEGLLWPQGSLLGGSPLNSTQ